MYRALMQAFALILIILVLKAFLPEVATSLNDLILNLLATANHTVDYVDQAATTQFPDHFPTSP